ncbi:YkgJ family cysteine cluster protein [Haloarcula hispanica]|uniref:YkgJ family cysteine cluster protein n=1 Tax=Haloarcula hispanica TaxID=51589 RepID=A0A482T1C6_HALHI|nr:YkgJ family cysteine cluster protein [Haloarcula hispanica]MCJ0619654.1 YkgJ family cysteine cluster protein [Haloarcula hispanica]RYJ10124.1 YkgJ family cysteine cluster protein [Haloarcula hispanica]
MDSLETELERARALDESELADAIETIGFECTRCGACCKAESACGERGEGADETDRVAGGAGENENDGSGETDAEPHTATVFPDEIRQLQAAGEYDFRDVARPMPYGLADGPDGPEGETFEWALQTDDCGDCTFYAEDDDGTGACTVHGDRPLICRTYPFSVALGGTSQPMGEAVDEEGMVRAHECEGLGRDISRADAEELAAALKERAVRELEEAIGVRDNYRPVDPSAGQVVVHDSEGAKRPDGSAYE